MNLYDYIPHPRIEARKSLGPPKTDDGRLGVNGKIGALITTAVGTMWAAYLFFFLTLVSLPATIASHNPVLIIQWIAQTFLQLVLLPIIIVGQNIQGKASDKRAIETYKDAEAILHECQQLQQHLATQDDVLVNMMNRVETMLTKMETT
ncbi:MAG: hypothetical protein HKL80_03235 [Acidimicrobiales bacterium]|nr:hypothetical protein [Acidimicrobiales bacterium]